MSDGDLDALRAQRMAQFVSSKQNRQCVLSMSLRWMRQLPKITIKSDLRYIYLNTYTYNMYL